MNDKDKQKEQERLAPFEKFFEQKKCDACNGTGWTNTDQYGERTYHPIPCPKCGGTGWKPK